MKHFVRSFAVGLIAAGLIMLLVFYIFEDTNSDELAYSTDEMISLIEDEGFRVITDKEYISYTVTSAQQSNGESSEQADENDSEEENSNDSSEEAADETEETVEEEETEVEVEENTSSVVINIPSGMPSLDISRLLESENLISDAEEFNDYLQQNDYALRIQLGEHELSTDMSFYQIAEALTN
ncbi:hypothetical protein [Oceanobacillus sp. CAU 1775]